MYLKKETYLNSANKYAVREFLFSFYNFKSIVGLAGPDINDYIKWCKSKGYNDFEIWENDSETLMKQMMSVKHVVRMRYGNILETSPNRIDTLYDLDYCATIKYMKEHLEKFKNNFIMTFSLRAGTEFTISKFFEDRTETIISAKEVESPLRHIIYTTKRSIQSFNSKYIFVPYCDTSAMCCIAKIK